MAPEKNDENSEEHEQEASSGHGESHEHDGGTPEKDSHEEEKKGEKHGGEQHREPHGGERDLEAQPQHHRRSSGHSAGGRTFYFVVPLRPLSGHVPDYQLERLACYFPIYGTLFAIAGALAIVLPIVFGVELSILFAWTLAGLGGVSLLLFFTICGAPGTIGALLLAALHLSVGVYLLYYPVEGDTALTFVVCCWFLAHGLLKAVLTIGLRKVTVWPLLLLSGLASFLLAFFVLALTPNHGTKFMGIAIGADLAATGAAVLSVSIMACFATGERAITDAEAMREPLLSGRH